MKHPTGRAVAPSVTVPEMLPMPDCADAAVAPLLRAKRSVSARLQLIVRSPDKDGPVARVARRRMRDPVHAHHDAECSRARVQ